MLHDGWANSREHLCRRVLLASLAIEYQSALRAKEKVDPDLPLAAAPRVKIRRQMVGGEIQAVQNDRLYPSHTRLGFTGPPE